MGECLESGEEKWGIICDERMRKDNNSPRIRQNIYQETHRTPMGEGTRGNNGDGGGTMGKGQ